LSYRNANSGIIDAIDRKPLPALIFGMSAMSSIRLVPKFSVFKGDEKAISGLRLMRCFLRLKGRARREELIAVAERMLEEDLTHSEGLAKKTGAEKLD